MVFSFFEKISFLESWRLENLGTIFHRFCFYLSLLPNLPSLKLGETDVDDVGANFRK